MFPQYFDSFFLYLLKKELDVYIIYVLLFDLCCEKDYIGLNIYIYICVCVEHSHLPTETNSSLCRQ